MQPNTNPCTCEITTQPFAIKYNGETRNILPIAVGRSADGTRYLIAAKMISGNSGPIKAYKWNRVSSPRNIHRAIYSIPRPVPYLNQLAAIDQEGVPEEWKSFQTIPAERVKGYNPKTKVVDTNPVHMTIYQ